jgi:hypothetical protein
MTKKTTRKATSKPYTARKNQYLCKPEKTWIRFAIQCIEEQLEVLAEGMSNEWNREGYLDEDGIEQAIRARQLNIVNLKAMLGD